MESLGLADILPSAAAAAGARWPNALGFPSSRVVVVVVLDGLGWVALLDNADVAPFLTSLDGRPLAAGFPATTATSLASIGIGRAPAEHGIIGYTTLLPEVDEPINWLRWRGAQSGRDLLDVVAPESVQPLPTVFERAADAGIASTMVAASEYRSSGLTRAILRGAEYRGIGPLADAVATIADTAAAGADTAAAPAGAAAAGADTAAAPAGATAAGADTAAAPAGATAARADTAAAPAGAAATIAGGGRRDSARILYAYLGDQDLIGHKYGPSSDPWRMQLTLIDRTLAMVAERLPRGTTMVVTADHGMVGVPDEARVDYDAEPVLRQDVVTLAGEGRARFIHTAPGRAAAVAERWQQRLGAGVSLMTVDDIVAAGWLGPEPPGPAIRARLGDLVAVSRDRTTVVRRRAERYLATMRGQHGARTDDELLVPLLTFC
jgi:Type I phosphodiesterase / nucleotide pyrophosphatase